MQENTHAAVEATVVAASQKTTVAAGGVSFVGWIAQIDWLAFLGIFIALLGLAINFYFSWQRNAREKAEHEMRMKKLNGDCDVK